jgi:hypothetical protein
LVHSPSVTVPEALYDAIRGEAARRLMRPGEVLADFMRTCWPQYVAGELARDLQPVLDAEAEEPTSDTEVTPGLPAASVAQQERTRWAEAIEDLRHALDWEGSP